MPTYVERVIIESARRHDVDPYTAVACATAESRLNPHAEGDYRNGVPTSFGLFQLHRGGELGRLTPEQAFDPQTNADVALEEMGRVSAAHPSWSPGAIAAGAQRPANPTAYASRVNQLYGALVGPHHTRLWRFLRYVEPTWQRGADVRALQLAIGGRDLTPDGVFGTVTLAHVQRWQASHSLASDGIVGPKTSAALGWEWAG